MRRCWRLPFAALALAIAALVASCGCDADCAGPDENTVSFVGTLVDRDGHDATFEKADGARVSVSVAGRAWALDRGEIYSVGAYRGETGILSAHLGRGCACGAPIRHLDGSSIDDSYWGWVEPRLATAALYTGVGFVAVTGLWGLARFGRKLLDDRV